MNKEDLKSRTKKFSLSVVHLIKALPKTQTGTIIGNQLLRAGTSVGANYRAACRSRSVAEFIAKLGIVIEEADESIYWMEILVESGLVEDSFVRPLINEANEITAIMVASSKTLKNNNKQRNLKA